MENVKHKPIWFNPELKPEDLLPFFCRNDMIHHLGIELVALGPDFLQLQMPVDHRTKQTFGLLHGGASAVLAETAGSIAANLCVDPTRYKCIGLSIYTQHIKSVTEGYVVATARPIHLGRRTQVWEIPIHHKTHHTLVSLSQHTVIVLSQ